MGLDDFRKFVLAELERSGASVSALSRRAGVSATSLNRCLRDGGGVSFATAARVLRALGWRLEVVRLPD